MKACVLLLLMFCAGCATQTGPQRARPEFKQAAGAMATMPFSEAVRVGDMLYISGSVGVKPGTRGLVEGGIVPETHQTMQNIKAVVERHGSSMNDVVKCLVMLADMKEWGQMNQVYVTYFPGNRPARSSFGANGLALNARVEIECIAVITK